MSPHAPPYEGRGRPLAADGPLRVLFGCRVLGAPGILRIVDAHGDVFDVSTERLAVRHRTSFERLRAGPDDARSNPEYAVLDYKRTLPAGEVDGALRDLADLPLAAPTEDLVGDGHFACYAHRISSAGDVTFVLLSNFREEPVSEGAKKVIEWLRRSKVLVGGI